eukprot:g2761.t1
MKGVVCGSASMGPEQIFDYKNVSFQQFAKSLVRNNTLMISFINWPLIQHFLNHFCHLKKLNLAQHHLLFAMDRKVHFFLNSLNKNINVWPAYFSHDTGELGDHGNEEQLHGSPAFAQLSKAKFVFTFAIIRLGINVIYSDVDVAILRDVFMIFDRPNNMITKEKDMVFLSDSLLDEDSIGVPFQYLCTGFFWVRSSIAVMNVIKEIMRYQFHPKNVYRDDQIAANAILYNYRRGHPAVRVDTFDPLLFPNGYTFFHEQLIQQLNVLTKPFVVHANYILTHRVKRFHMQVHGLWLVKAKKNPRCLTENEQLSVLSRSGYKSTGTIQINVLRKPVRFSRTKVAGMGHDIALAKANDAKRTLLLTCAPVDVDKVLLCPFEKLANMLNTTSKVFRSNKCNDLKGKIVSNHLKKGFHILWLDYTASFGILLNQRNGGRAHAINGWIDKYLLNLRNPYKHVTVNFVWQAFKKVFEDVKKDGQQKRPMKMKSSAAIAIGRKHREQSLKEKRQAKIKWDAFFVNNMDKYRSFLVDFFGKQLYKNIKLCKYKQQNPFTNGNRLQIDGNVNCRNEIIEEKGELKSASIGTLKLRLFNPLRVVSKSETFFHHKLPQKLGIRPILVSTRSLNASQKSKILTIFNMCCRCGKDSSSFVEQWENQITQHSNHSKQTFLAFRKYRRYLKTNFGKEGLICEFGFDVKRPYSIFALDEHTRRGNHSMRYLLFYNEGNGHVEDKLEPFVDSRLDDKSWFRALKVGSLAQHKRNYPHIQCDLIVVHRRASSRMHLNEIDQFGRISEKGTKTATYFEVGKNYSIFYKRS